MKEKLKLPSLKGEMATIVVLALSAVIFIAAILMIYSEDFLHGAGEIFNVYGGEVVEYDVATINEIVSEDSRPDDAISDVPVGSQDLKVTVTSGRFKGEEMVVQNYFGALSGVPARVGESVTLIMKIHADGTHSGVVYELNRTRVMAVFLLAFALVVVIFGRMTGFKSLVGLAFTGVCLFAVLIPLALKGAPIIPTTFVVCAYITLVCFAMLSGVHRKGVCAFLGTVAGMFFAMVCGLLVQHFARIDGLRLEDAEPLYQLALYQDIHVDIRGLLVASIIICSLGAVMDVAMSISSALEEIHVANPALTQKELFESGVKVGRDMAGTMTNTLILAFMGGEFTLMIFIYARNYTFYHLFSTAFIVLETISGFSSSLGMILAIPLTALISSVFITKGWPKE